jgi:peroxiredoxin
MTATIGNAAPDFEILNQHGEKVLSPHLKERRMFC